MGLAVAALFVAWAMTPSLIPRDWLFQGLVSGVTGVLGHGLGVVIAVLSRRTRLAAWLRGRPRWLRATGWGVLIVGVIATVVVMTVAAARWQRALGALMGADIPTTPAYLRCGAMLVAVFMLLLLTARGLRVVARLLARGLHRWVHLPRLLAGGVAVGARGGLGRAGRRGRRRVRELGARFADHARARRDRAQRRGRGASLAAAGTMAQQLRRRLVGDGSSVRRLPPGRPPTGAH
ncbi:hypothetical protein RHODO2019_06460 [Rhodococcus antarcticus]|uniref:Alpha/beta-hydrolase N-terminal domain-containing protein n=1 Tax=Rhodococcus antarcticus TaxID=2987751 RepID=A0ABY6P328_9NOCA|nr:alpha/beta-hydrolase N-terminal domain-containing protein [Rhodococcus antarcticus]UZJ26069.1 hypothetical protein RHODO2019_06460 [Rhodococcus antarcticus]